MSTDDPGANVNRAHSAATLPYLPGIDGLRALAVAAVFVYHAVGAPLRGGFLGVDLFFVISGYLITAGLLSEWRQRQRIAVFAFWLRRARRLLPAAFTLILTVLAIAAVLVPDDLYNARSGALAAAGFLTNWYLVLGHAPYFETIGRPPLLQHLWSLAVEEQFYLLWPGVLYVALRWLRPTAVLALIVLLAAASSVLMYLLYQSGADPARLYYGTDTHATGLLAGAALAFVRAPGSDDRSASLRLDLVGGAGLVVLGASMIWFDESRALLYTGGLTLVAVASALVVMAAVQPRTRVARLLSSAPLRWLGVRSYSVYLWHWPVLMLTRTDADVALRGLPLLALQTAVTLALAECSYRYIERPVRSGALSRICTGLRRLPANPSFRGDALFTGGLCGLAAVVLLLITAATAPAGHPPTYLASSAVRGELGGASATSLASEPTVRSAELAPDSPATDVPAARASVLSASVAAVSTDEAVPPSGADDYTQGSEPTVTAVGDSVMLGAAAELARAFGTIDLDAVAGRSVTDVVRVLRERQQAGRLASTVIVQVGNNGALTAVQVEQLMQPLVAVSRVLVMNVRVARPWEEPNGAVLAEVIRQYPNAELVDWHGASAQHPEFFWDDQTHLRPEGAAVYAQLLAGRAGRLAEVGSLTRRTPGS